MNKRTAENISLLKLHPQYRDISDYSDNELFYELEKMTGNPYIQVRLYKMINEVKTAKL